VDEPPGQRADLTEARRLIRTGALTMVFGALACGAVLAATGARSGAFILAAAISVLAVLRTGQGIARLRRARRLNR
jgi:hypothetical protein